LERALKLFIDGDVKLSDIDLTKSGKKTKIPPKHNKVTGKDSTAVLAFSDVNWGTQTRCYMTSIGRRHPHVISYTTEKARTIAKMRRSGGSSQADANEASEDERALI
ncbi:hypothetical protein BV22DRAFT_1025738, partial [Leucogyrophana mollusca]